MKVLKSIVVGAIVLSHAVVTMATEVNCNAVAVDGSSVNITTDSDSEQVQSTTISLDRADLRQPHLLRVRGSGNMERVDVKINGRLVKSIVNGSIELDLAPMMKVGSYQVEISGTSPRLEDTISLTFTGTNTNISQQSSGSGIIKQILVIDVQ
ncbi:hypothetical protein [Chamaesiphon sp. VAR_48_metabat_135_sub]|uniref:hypothetical protein n=1 Tax=Chamaesiphon sp. VAR_48_metabat_135_sub TaxID=2964699 RepID=UPI00286C83A9|nr:hypothetical protein [Chamaesiphon sp. VAR_48_metabat_135_sub]